MIGVSYVHAGPEALRRFRIGKECKRMASKRHGMITRAAVTYDILVTLHNGKKERQTVVLRKRNDEAALRQVIRRPQVMKADIRGIYKDIYALYPLRFFEAAEIIQRESVLM